MYEGFFSKFFSKKKKVIEEPKITVHKKLSELNKDIIDDLIPDILEIQGAISDFQLWKRGFKRYVVKFTIENNWKYDLDILLSDLNRLEVILKDDYDLSFFIEISFFIKLEYSDKVEFKIEMEKFINFKDLKNYILSKKDYLDCIRQVSIRFEEKT